ncbi:MAG TPA: hypothetical protein VHV57_21090 [Acidimicrobiales bacterium]|nr:hypothetical protein [Acidimicrobiales bacterium]
MRNKIAALVLIVLSVAVAPLVVASQSLQVAPAGALLPCADSPYTNYLAGVAYPSAYPQSSMPSGSAAYLVTRPGHFCSNATQGVLSSAWSMIAGSGPGQWAQAGFESASGYRGGAYVYFTQYNDGNTSNTCNGVCSTWLDPTGTTNDGANNLYYEAYYTFAPCYLGCEALVVNSTVETFTPFSIYGTVPGWSGWSHSLPEFSGEAYNAATDVPGNGTDGWATFTQMEYENGQNLSNTWSGYDNPFFTAAVDGTNDPRATHDAVINGGGTRGNAMDVYCDSTCTP